MPENWMPEDMTYTHTIADLFDERRLLLFAKGFQGFFGNSMNGSKTFFVQNRETFNITIIRAGRRIAAMIPRGISGTLVKSKLKAGTKSSLFSRSFPLSHEEDVIHVAETLKRLPNEPPYATDDLVTRQMRMMVLAAEKHEDQIRTTGGLNEYLAAQSILRGQMPAILGTTNPDEIYDWQRDPDNTLTPTSGQEWNDSGDILAQIDAGCDQVQIRGKGDPKMLLMGQDAWIEYLANTVIKAYHDNRRYELAKMSPAEPFPEMFDRFTGPGGFQPRGTLITPKGRKLYLFSYDQYYEDENDDIHLYMPKDEAVIADPMLIANRYFGPGQKFWNTRVDNMWMEDRFGFTEMNLPMPENMPPGDIFDKRMYHFYAYEQDKETVTIVTQGASVYATNQTDAICTLEGLIDYP